MKALTLHRPWSDAIAAGVKDIENRTWPLPAALVGKTIAIHGGKAYDREGALEMIETWMWAPPPDYASPLGIVAVVIFGRPITAGWYAANGLPRSPWFSGPVGWPIRSVVRVEPAIPCRGAQGLWTVTPRVEEALQPYLARLK